MDVKIRELKIKDIKVLAAILTKLMVAGRNLVPKISNTMSEAKEADSDSDDDAEEIGSSIIEIGISIIENLIAVGDTDILNFFADLVGKTREEFDDMPLVAMGEIFKQLRAEPAAESFFTQLSSYAKRTPFYKIYKEKMSGYTNTTSESEAQNWETLPSETLPTL